MHVRVLKNFYGYMRAKGWQKPPCSPVMGKWGGFPSGVASWGRLGAESLIAALLMRS